jgi:hypothetical protein
MKKWRFSNKAIVIIKLTTTCVLFFACCLFFFQNMDIFKADLGLETDAEVLEKIYPKNVAPNIIYPLIFFSGIVFIITYIANMVARFESKTLWKADRLYILYQFVFLAVVAVVIWRWFLINLSVATWSGVIILLCGIVTLVTPKIVDNNNNEF